MQLAKRFPPPLLAHHNAETETAVWIMIVLLVGIASFAMFNLLDKVTG